MVTAAKLWVEEQNESRPERAARARAARGRRAHGGRLKMGMKTWNGCKRSTVGIIYLHATPKSRYS